MSTFAQIQSDILEELNLTSTTATARVGRNINKVHRELCSSLGLEMTSRGVVKAMTTIGNRSLVFNGAIKVLSVFDPSVSPVRVLDETLFDEMRNSTLGTDPAQVWALQSVAATSVTVMLDCVPATSYELDADATITTQTLSGDMTPSINEDFHDLLMYKPMAIELRKMEKYAQAEALDGNGNPDARCLYNNRLGQLRLFYAKSAYLQLHQGKSAASPITVATAKV